MTKNKLCAIIFDIKERERMNFMKITMYGGEFCINCREAKELLKDAKNIELNIKDITTTTGLMKEFLDFRDHEPMFEEVKAQGRIGIPFFILEDGTKTFDIYEVLKLDQPKEVKNACSLDGSKSC